MSIEVTQLPMDQFGRIAGAWNEVVLRSNARYPFLTHEWISSVLTHFGAGREPWILSLSSNGEVVGYVPLWITSSGYGPFRVRTLEFIGWRNSDYLGFPVVCEEQAALEAVLGFALKESKRWDLLRFSNLVDSKVATQVEAISKKHGLQSRTETGAKCPYVSLEGRDWEQYFASLSRHLRHDVRKKTKRIEQEFGVLGFEIRTDYDPALTEQLLDLHMKRWAERQQVSTFRKEEIRGFYHDISSALAASGLLCTPVLTVNGRVVAYRYGFHFDDKFFDSLTSYDPNLFEVSPGKLLIYEALKAMNEYGFREFDFLNGAEPYKLDWTSTLREVVTVEATRPQSFSSFKIMVLRFIGSVRRRVVGSKQLQRLRFWVSARTTSPAGN